MPIVDNGMTSCNEEVSDPPFDSFIEFNINLIYLTRCNNNYQNIIQY